MDRLHPQYHMNYIDDLNPFYIQPTTYLIKI